MNIIETLLEIARQVLALLGEGEATGIVALVQKFLGDFDVTSLVTNIVNIVK